MAQVAGFLTPVWKGLDRARGSCISPGHCRYFESEPAEGHSLFVSFPCKIKFKK